VEKKLVLPIAAASVVSAVAAAALANRLPAQVLRIAFGALLLWIGVRMAWKPAPKQSGPGPKTEPAA